MDHGRSRTGLSIRLPTREDHPITPHHESPMLARLVGSIADAGVVSGVRQEERGSELPNRKAKAAGDFHTRPRVLP